MNIKIPDCLEPNDCTPNFMKPGEEVPLHVMLTAMHDIIEELKGMVGQHCSTGVTDLDTLDSMALSANASAMRTLAKYGFLKITDQYGKRVIAEWNGD